jgi:hypothetical protein
MSIAAKNVVVEKVCVASFASTPLVDEKGFTIRVLNNSHCLFNLCSLVAFMFCIIALLGLTLTEGVSGGRILTGQCRPESDTSDPVGKETARRVVSGITNRESNFVSLKCVQSSYSRHARHSPERRQEYFVGFRDSHMTIPLQLFNYLADFSSESGRRETDVQFVWDEYISRHPGDASRTDCAKMYVWYTTVFGLGNPGMLEFSDNSVEIRKEHQGLVAYVDLVRIASQATREDQLPPIDRPICSYERFVAARSAVADIAELEVALGRPARFVTAGELGIIRSNRDRILSDYEESEVAELEALRVLGPKQISLAEGWLHVENPNHALSRNYFIHRLMYEIVSETFPSVAPSWYDVRQLFSEEFPKLRDTRSTEYQKFKAMTEAVVETIALSGTLLRGIIEQSVTPASLQPSQGAWVTRVLVPNIGKSIGSLDLVRCQTHVYRGYIPRSMEVVRELLEARFGRMSGRPPRMNPAPVVVPVRSLLHRIPDRIRIFEGFNPTHEPPVFNAKRARVPTAERVTPSTNGLYLLLQAISAREE